MNRRPYAPDFNLGNEPKHDRDCPLLRGMFVATLLSLPVWLGAAGVWLWLTGRW